MELNPSNPTFRRGTRSSLSAMLIVGLLIGVTVSTFQPGIRGLIRDPGTEVTRHITATLARAVRELVGSDTHRPAVAATGSKGRWADSAKGSGVELAPRAIAVRMLRASLLAMPPPAA